MITPRHEIRKGGVTEYSMRRHEEAAVRFSYGFTGSAAATICLVGSYTKPVDMSQQGQM